MLRPPFDPLDPETWPGAEGDVLARRADVPVNVAGNSTGVRKPRGSAGLRSRRTGVPTEQASQAAVIAWANLASRTWPELRWLFAIPNGAFYGSDRRAAAIHAEKLRKSGLKPGVVDLFLPAARRGFHGLWIEMKRKGEQTTDDQDKFIAFVTNQGYHAQVCYSAEEAIALLRDYLGAML